MTKLLSRWQRLGWRIVSRRALMAASLVWLLATLLPLVLISFDAYPAHDDFVHALPVTEAWVRTGSLWATLEAAWERTAVMYHTWQGTFVAMFFSALSPMAFSADLFFLTPILTLAGLCLAGAYFCKALIRKVLGAEPSVCVILYALLMTLLLQFLPSPREVFYWHSGTLYVWSVTMMLWMLGLLFRLREPASAVRTGLRIACLALAGVVLGGCPYPLGLGGMVGFGLVRVWRFRRKARERWGSLAAFLAVTVSLAVVCLAPGNGVRQAIVASRMESASLGPVRAIVQSLFQCMTTTGAWLPLQLLGAALLIPPLLVPALRRSELRFSCPGWVSFFSFGVLAAAFVPPIYATGIEGYQVERILSSLYMLYVLLLLLNVVYWAGYLAKRKEAFSAAVESRLGKGLPVWQITLCVCLLAWSLCTNAVTTTLGTSAAAAKSLLTGEAARYHQEMLGREKRILESGSAEEAKAGIRELTSVPAVFPRDKVPGQQDGGLGMIPVMYRYFQMHRLATEYGIGQVPQSEWEAMEAWAAE